MYVGLGFQGTLVCTLVIWQHCTSVHVHVCCWKNWIVHWGLAWNEELASGCVCWNMQCTSLALLYTHREFHQIRKSVLTEMYQTNHTQWDMVKPDAPVQSTLESVDRSRFIFCFGFCTSRWTLLHPMSVCSCGGWESVHRCFFKSHRWPQGEEVGKVSWSEWLSWSLDNV